MFLDLTTLPAPSPVESDDAIMAREFLAFARSKPADEAYDYWDSSWAGGAGCGCAIVQFCVARGLAWREYVKLDSHDSLVGDAVIETPWVWGALSNRLAAALVS